MPIGPARMPLFDHLGELRMRLVRIVACLAVAVVVCVILVLALGIPTMALTVLSL